MSRSAPPAAARARGVALAVLVALLTVAAPGVLRAAGTQPYTVRIDAPDDLATLLTNYLDITRFRESAVEQAGGGELARLVAATPEQARALLRTEGYFDARVDVQTEPGDAAPRIVVTVQPGPRVVVRSVELQVTDAPDDAALKARLLSAWRMPVGTPFRQAAWDDAKNQLLVTLQEDRYAAARWVSTHADIDPTHLTADLRVQVQRGPAYTFGSLRIEGAARYPQDVAQTLWRRGVGDPYSLKDLLDYQEQLLRTTLYDAAVVEAQPLAPAPGEAASTVVPIVVKLRERPKQSIVLGVGYSADNGPRMDVEHTTRAPFGLHWIARQKIEVARSRQAASTDWTSYPLDNRYRNLVSAGVERLTSAGAPVRTETARLGRTQDTERIERLYYAEVVRSVIEASGGNVTASALSGNYQWTLRDVDNLRFPTRGLTLQAQAGAGVRYGGANDKRPFSRVYGRLTLYQPFGTLWFGQARVEGGYVAANNADGIPDALLFRAGGDDSVRGYAYRSLGVNQFGTIVGGRVLLTGSVELARSVSPGWLAAAFIDAGNASDSPADWRAVVGYGIGARWRSPVGPLKLDLAYAHQLRRLRLQLSVGVVF